jgi:hypothetical protein
VDVTVLLLVWVTLELLVLLEVAGPVVTDAVPSAVFDEVAAGDPAAEPVEVWVVPLVWSYELAAVLKPLFADADWPVQMSADWSVDEPVPVVAEPLTVELLVWPADEVELLVADAAPVVTFAPPVAPFDESAVRPPPLRTPVEVWVVPLVWRKSFDATLPPVFDLARCSVATCACWSVRLAVPLLTPVTPNADAASATTPAADAAVPMMNFRDFNRGSFAGDVQGSLLMYDHGRPGEKYRTRDEPDNSASVSGHLVAPRRRACAGFSGAAG